MIAILENQVRVIHENLKPEDFYKYSTELTLILNHLTMDENNNMLIEALNNSFTFFRVEVNEDHKTIHRINVNSDMPQIDENKPLLTVPDV